MKVSIDLTGSEDVIRSLNYVSKNFRNKVLRKAVNAGIKPVAKVQKQNAKQVKDTGTLWRSIGSKTKIYRSGTAVGIIGPRKGYGIVIRTRTRGKNVGAPVKRDPIFYAHLVEYGTFRSKAKPFLRPAWDSTKDKAKTLIVETVKAGLKETK